MKFKVTETKRGNAYYSLTGIKQSDVYFSNLAAREQPGSPYKPKNVIGIWLNDDNGVPAGDMAEEIASYGFNVKSISTYDWIMKGNNEERKDEIEGNPKLKKELMEELKYFMVFTVYPNKLKKYLEDQKNNPWKKKRGIYIYTTANQVAVEPDNLGLVDATRISEMGIEWAEYVYMDRMVASVDYMIILADESAAEDDSSYLDVVYGNPDVEITAEDEEVPFS